jgi:hypothetical protein
MLKVLSFQKDCPRIPEEGGNVKHAASLVTVLLAVGHAQAEVVIDHDEVIDYTINDLVRIVEGTNPAPPTTVDIVSGGRVDSHAQAEDSSVLNLFGGSIGNSLAAHDTSTVNVYGGRVNQYIFAEDSSTVHIFDVRVGEGIDANLHSQVYVYGGEFVDDEAAFYEWSRGIISGGSFEDVSAYNWSTVEISGGDIGGVWAEQSGRADISGGLISKLVSGWDDGKDHDCVITVYGTDFNYLYGPIPDGAGTLTGTLRNGDPLNVPFAIYSDASIVLAVPEPSTLVLLTTIAAGPLLVVRHRRRKVITT